MARSWANSDMGGKTFSLGVFSQRRAFEYICLGYASVLATKSKVSGPMMVDV